MNKLMSDYFWTKEQDSAYLKDFTDESVYLEMPLVNMVYRMLDMAAEGIPLTKVGNPTSAVIEELYPLGPKDFLLGELSKEENGAICNSRVGYNLGLSKICRTFPEVQR